MKINKIDLGDGCSAGYTERRAFNPGNPYDGFNICHYTNDSPEHIAACRKSLSLTLGINPGQILIPRQTHSTNVAVIDNPAEVNLENTDGLVTANRSLLLCINTADCVPVVLHDSVAGVIGICHAGWRGMVNGVIQHTVSAMLAIGATPSGIQAAMGPCICTNCFEVGPEVAEQFTAWPHAVVQRPEWAKPHINLAAAATAILHSYGVNKVAPPDECTRCEWQRLFSARRLGINSGRMLTFISLAT